MQQHWIFGYGSLIWRPGFDYLESRPALLRGAHRSLCVRSFFHRGTPHKPGLVLGLDRGGACRGVAYRVDPSSWDRTVAYLREREQVTMVYIEAFRPVSLPGDDGATVKALCYRVDRDHEQYAGRLDLETRVDMVRHGVGRSGTNPEYLFNTVERLRELGIHDSGLEAVCARLAEPGDR